MSSATGANEELPGVNTRVFVDVADEDAAFDELEDDGVEVDPDTGEVLDLDDPQALAPIEEDAATRTSSALSGMPLYTLRSMCMLFSALALCAAMAPCMSVHAEGGL